MDFEWRVCWWRLTTTSKYRIEKNTHVLWLQIKIPGDFVCVCANKYRKKSKAMKTIERDGQYFVYSLCCNLSMVKRNPAVWLIQSSSIVCSIVYNKQTMSYQIFILYEWLKQLLAHKCALIHDHRETGLSKRKIFRLEWIYQCSLRYSNHQHHHPSRPFASFVCFVSPSVKIYCIVI